jgi:hypothetical protein
MGKKKIHHFGEGDENILKLIINNMRGGICSRGELTYMNVYNKPGEHIVYLDMNNLYGKAMILNLPVSDYELDENEYEGQGILNEILNYDFMNEKTGYILECDIDPPDNKELFNGYPLFPEKIDLKLEVTLLPKRHYFVHIA